jgi:hypothetical protein
MYNSQIRQDIFVDKLLKKREGFFVDIGAGVGELGRSADAGFYSNSFFFEEHRGWNGIAVDYDKRWYKNVQDARSCIVSCVDLLKVNVNDHLESLSCPEKIDYLSIDVDAAQRKVFDEFDWEKYKFSVLTLEHNLYQSLDSCEFTGKYVDYRDNIALEYDHYRNKLKSYGYKILWGNVELSGYGPVEDWWVSEEIYEKYKEYKKENVNCDEIIDITFE